MPDASITPTKTMPARRVAAPEAVLDQSQWVEWRGGPAHDFRTV